MPVIKIDLTARKKYLEAHPSLHKVEDIYDMLKDKAKEVFITGFKDYPDIDIDSIFAEFVEFALRAVDVVDRIWDQHAELAGKYGDAEMAEFASILCSILSKKSNDELESEIEGAFKYNKGSFKFTHRMCHNLCTAISYKLGLDYPEDYDEAKEVLLKKRDECLNEALIYAPFAHDNRMGYLFHLWDTTIRWPEKFRYKDTSRMIFLYQLGVALMLYSPEPGLELDEIRGKGADRKEIAESVRTTIRKHLAFLEKYKPLKDEADMEEIRELRKRMLEQKSQNS